ncbi:MAG: MotA/TolQ/ExbB proton channel family protein [Thermoprotei archaeon]|nr:MAG: MotA/TolQ/ExbB proton channel family protein [Thermoprotei archaeon]
MVMFPLFISSIAMWMMIINRLIVFRALNIRDIDRDKAKECILNNNLPDMDKYNGFRAMFVNRFLKRRSGKSDPDRYILDETVMHMVSSMDRYLVYIGVLAAVSPLFGLLGTVMGMMATFDIISMFGTGNAKAMAGGISEALISTQTGLLVAIPGLYMYNLLLRRADNLKHKIASTGYYLRRFV